MFSVVKLTSYVGGSCRSCDSQCSTSVLSLLDFSIFLTTVVAMPSISGMFPSPIVCPKLLILFFINSQAVCDGQLRKDGTETKKRMRTPEDVEPLGENCFLAFSNF